MAERRKSFAVLCSAIIGLIVLLCLTLVLIPSFINGRAQLHCWIRVVDQHGQGVEGYEIEVVEDGMLMLPNFLASTQVRQLQTKKNGVLEYKARGGVDRVIFGHWGSQWRRNSEHLMERQNLAVGAHEVQSAARKDPTGYLGSRDNPYLIHVLSVKQPRRLLYWDAAIGLADPHGYLCVDILSGRTWESPEPGGDVAIIEDGRRPGDEAPHCYVHMVGGPHCNLYPVVDDWGIEPPEGGYTRELCDDRDWPSKRRGYSGPTQFYYHIQEEKTARQLYGRIKLGPAPGGNGARIENYTNLQGERNLYYKGYTDLLDQKILDFVSPPVQQNKPAAGR
jgi:hypothetical protein